MQDTAYIRKKKKKKANRLKPYYCLGGKDPIGMDLSRGQGSGKENPQGDYERFRGRHGIKTKGGCHPPPSLICNVIASVPVMVLNSGTESSGSPRSIAPDRPRKRPSSVERSGQPVCGHHQKISLGG